MERNYNRSSSEDVERVDFPCLYEMRLSLDNLAHARKNPYAGEAAHLEVLVNLPDFFRLCARNCDYGFVKRPAFYHGRNRLYRAENGNPFYLSPNQILVVIKECGDTTENFFSTNILSNHLACETRTDDI